MSWSSIQGPATMITAAVARIFGMKVSVCSWICVTAWKIETIEADDEAGEQQREPDLHRELHRVDGEETTVSRVMPQKLWTRDWVTRLQPSTRTNRRILNGRR